MGPSSPHAPLPAASAELARLAWHLPDAAATLQAGRRFAGGLAPGMVITLAGDLGAGKTTLVRGMLAGLGWTGSVKSPTYTLVEHYGLSSLYFYHFDFYRIENPDEWASAGFDEYFGDRSVCVVEWPERVGAHLPAADLSITLAYADEASGGRDLVAVARSEAGLRCLNAAAAAKV